MMSGARDVDAPAAPNRGRSGLLTMDQSYSSKDIFVSISGMIGAGKTTLADALGKLMNLPVFHEPVMDNAYLEDFYKDKSRYGFPLQVYLLNRRFQQHQEIIWSGKGGVQDRTIYEDTVFAKVLYEEGNMQEREYATYRSLFSNMSNFMKKPNLIVHLDVTPEQSYERICMRSRNCEEGIPMAYLRRLHAAYEDFLQDISRIIPVIRVDYSKFHDANDMAEMVMREYSSMTSIRHVADPSTTTTDTADDGEDVVGTATTDIRKIKESVRAAAATGSAQPVV
eukprot:m.172938 g.172938  ORF g.172938 m.172938 type:complete len:281 (-) comp18295_c0_seq1:164-1006(-)